MPQARRHPPRSGSAARNDQQAGFCLMVLRELRGVDLGDGARSRVLNTRTRELGNGQVTLASGTANLARRSANALVENCGTGRMVDIEVGEADSALQGPIRAAGAGECAHRGHANGGERATDCGLHNVSPGWVNCGPEIPYAVCAARKPVTLPIFSWVLSPDHATRAFPAPPDYRLQLQSRALARQPPPPAPFHARPRTARPLAVPVATPWRSARIPLIHTSSTPVAS